MYEVIISQVSTGKVTRQQFATRDEADLFIQRHEEKLMYPRPPRKPRSLSDYRVEVQYRERRPARQLMAQAA